MNSIDHEILDQLNLWARREGIPSDQMVNRALALFLRVIEGETISTSPIRVKDVVDLATICPTQFEAKTEDGREVYIRYRWGNLTVEINECRIFDRRVGDDLDGEIAWSAICEHVNIIEV